MKFDIKSAHAIKVLRANASVYDSELDFVGSQGLY
jgi:hypothetical protein